MEIDSIISASWIIPVIPRAAVLSDSSLAIHQGKILALGPSDIIRQRYTTQQHWQLPGQALIPGLVNAHGHAAMSLMRGIADDKPLMTWLQEHIWPLEATWVNERYVTDGSHLAIAEMLASGTTCFSDMYFYPESTAQVAAEAGIRAQITTPVLDFPTAWAQNADEYINKGLALHTRYSDHPHIHIGLGPHAPYTVSDEPLKKIAAHSRALNLPIQIHVHETADEVNESLKTFGMRPLQRLHQLGLLSPLTQCVHMTQVNEEDIACLQSSGAHVIHCPESNLKLNSGLCPVQQLLDAGINVALGTDGAASNNDLDVSDEMRSAALIGKITANNASAVNAVSALEMATLNGAKALGLDRNIGSLEAGKQADIAAIDLSGLSHTPMYDPISHIVYTKAGHMVSHLWVGGRPLISEQKHTRMDIAQIQHTARSWQQKLSAH